MCDKPGGLGPWFNCLFFNTHDKSKKKTHIIAHTHPHLGLDYLNRNYEGWAIVQKIGPFERWQDAVDFHKAWNEKTRGKVPRFERGIELFCLYKDRYRLNLWMPVDKTQQDIISEFKKKRQRDGGGEQQQQQQQQQTSHTQLVIVPNEVVLQNMLDIFSGGDVENVKIGRIRSQEMKKRKK